MTYAQNDCNCVDNMSGHDCAYGVSPSDTTVTVVGCIRFKVGRRTCMRVMGVQVTNNDNKHDKGVRSLRLRTGQKVGIITTVPTLVWYNAEVESFAVYFWVRVPTH